MKSILKSILASILILSLLAGFAACSENDSTEPVNPAPAAAGNTDNETTPQAPEENDDNNDDDAVDPGDFDDLGDLDLDDLFGLGDIFGNTDENMTADEFLSAFEEIVDALIDLVEQVIADPESVDMLEEEAEELGMALFGLMFAAWGVAMDMEEGSDEYLAFEAEVERIIAKLEAYEEIVDALGIF